MIKSVASLESSVLCALCLFNQSGSKFDVGQESAHIF